MAINLQKGQRIGLGLSKVGVGLGWDPNSGTGFDFDLDASAFMLGENKKIPQDEFFVFYNNPKSPDGAVESSGDDLTGGSSDGDDETLTIDIARLDSKIQEIIFTVTIHDYETRKQNFGQVRNSFIRIYNAQTNEEIAKYELDEDFSVETAVEFGRIYKRNDEWKFEAMGIGYKGDTFDLSQVTVGLGWDIRKKKGGFLSGLLGGDKEEDYDLDAIAFLLDANGKVVNLGRKAKMPNGKEINLYEGDVVYFNSQKHPSGNIWLTGDNRTGAGEGDDEQIIVRLDSLDQKYQKILFLVTIYQGKAKNQSFGMVDNAFIRAVDAKGKEIAKFNLSGDASLNGVCGMIFAEVYRREGTWKFRALGEPQATDNFVEILKKYINN